MIRLRCATRADIPLLKYWDTLPHVIEAGGGEWEWDVEIPFEAPWLEQFVAEEDGRPVGFIQIIDPAEEQTHYWGECEPDLRAIDIWIGEVRDLGRGLGTEMMQLALSRCFADPRIKAVLVDPMASNIRAHRFYQRNGFQFAERRMFGSDDCHVMRVSREAWLAGKP
ncbi:MAG: acetyltransferase [Hyphomicrobiales bacterium]|nr:acetyltransferase [Hyphomicrobiales bacterium]